MSSNEKSTNGGLPANAYTELKSGEEYVPIMSPHITFPEVTPYSVITGLVMAVIFSAAAAYLGLKIGQVFEAAIPIAILAVGISSGLKKKGALGQNVIIQSIGATSGAVVAGAIFTLPAIYILKLEVQFYQTFLASLLGGFLGILFLIPFRKYFVAEMHGQFPFPEATATTEVLIAGEKGGKQAMVLVVSGLIGGIYDFVVASFGSWSEIFTTKVIPAGQVIAEKIKLEFRLSVSSAILGLGYIIGPKYSAIMVAGSFLSWFVILPIIAYFGAYITTPLGANVTLLIKDMSAEQIFKAYVRHIGIGGIAMAGLIGIIRSSGIIKKAFTLGFHELLGKKINIESLRTQRDLAMKIIFIGILLTAVLIFVFFLFGVVTNIFQALVGLLIVLVIAFLFTTVAATAIAIVGTNPVSGMTLMTLILSSAVLVSVGLSGPAGMISALIIGGVVCTALSQAGAFITDLKIGYWLGSSPYKQEKWKFVGTIVSAATVAWIMMVLNQTYGFVGDNALVAPQANAMAAVIQPLMSNQPAPWMLYLAGAILALILTMLRVPALAFALGMYIPMELNTPLLVGGLISLYVSTRKKGDEKLNTARRERGTLIASGFIAGGALFGVFSAILRYSGFNCVNTEWQDSHSAEMLALIMFCLISFYMIWDSLRAKKEE